MINPWNLFGRSVQNVSKSYTVDVYLTTLLNPRRLHTIACRTFSCQLASAEKNNIIISIIKKVLSGYPHEWSGFHTKTNSRRKYFMASSSATLCAYQCSFAIILWSFKSPLSVNCHWDIQVHSFDVFRGVLASVT